MDKQKTLIDLIGGPFWGINKTMVKALGFDCSIVYNEIYKQNTEKRKRISYNDYLHSDHWQFLRRFILRADNYKCRICNSPENLNVHHRTYKHLWDEEHYLNDLVTLCKNCHELFSKNSKLKY